ncbi:MAG: Gp49 family protein [Bacteroidales bacterium]|nr:Gp49 family protein [Bacteroidales bacterium]
MANITVTKEEVAENMKDVLIRTEIEFGKPTTYVTVKMKNGFTIRESTTCVDPNNYDEEIGKKICLEKLEDKVWFLLGYALQEKIYQLANK